MSLIDEFVCLGHTIEEEEETMEIRPKQGLGPLNLCDPVGLVLDCLHDLPDAKKIDVCMVQEDPLSACFTLEVPKLALRLVFEPHSQTLVAIEVMDLQLICCSYRGSAFSSGIAGGLPDYHKVSQLFGPSTPPKIGSDRECVVEYRGCAFICQLTRDTERRGGKEKRSIEDLEGLLVQRVFLYAGNSFRESIQVKSDVESQIEADPEKGVFIKHSNCWITFQDYAQDV
jgi:hypothetical protein